MDATPSAETLKFAFYISTSIIGFLLLIVGYFIAQQFSVQKSLTQAISDLKTIVAVIKSQQQGTNLSCSKTHKTIDQRLNAHAKQIDTNEKDIAIINTKLGIHEITK